MKQNSTVSSPSSVEATLLSNIEKAWLLRWNQEIEAALALTLVLQNQTQKAPEPLLLRMQSEVQLLMASILRAQGKMSESKKRFTAIEAQIGALEFETLPRLSFERGIFQFLDRNYLDALESFTRYRQSPLTQIQDLVVLSNIVLCLEYLGFPYQAALREFRTGLDALKSSEEKPLPQLRRQLSGFDYRIYFRSGEISELLKAEDKFWNKKIPNTLDFGVYFAAFTQALPYHLQHRRFSSEDAASWVQQTPFFFQKSYRLRTLMGVWHPDDLHASVPEKVFRLYHWVWRWLADRSQFSTQKIAILVDQVFADPGLAELSPECRMILRNALQWISIIDPAVDQVSHRYGELFDFSTSSFFAPLFDFEFQFLQWIKTIKTSAAHAGPIADDYRKNLEHHPLWNNKNLLFSSLVQSIESNTKTEPRLQSLVDWLRDLIFNSSDTKVAFYSVNLETFVIQDHQKDSKIISEPLALALDLLYRKKTVEVEEFCRICFGIRNYDSSIHQPRVFNLLTRIKEFLGSAYSIRFRNQRLFAEGPWELLEFKHPNSLASALRSQPEWIGFQGIQRIQRRMSLPRFSENEHRRILNQILPEKEYTRNELETIVGGSRATSIRRINELLSDEVLVKVGQARATRYKLSAKTKETPRSTP